MLAVEFLHLDCALTLKGIYVLSTLEVPRRPRANSFAKRSC